MSKKSFKDNTANIDKFFSNTVEKTHNADETHKTQSTQKTSEKYYRINLKLKGDFKEYLQLESWKVKKSVTEYLNDLIEEDKNKKENNSLDI